MKKSITFLLCLLLTFAFALSAFAETEEISLGKTYSLVTPASEAYPDDGKKLTDGDYGRHLEDTDGYYASGAYVGFNKENINENGKFSVIIDLGEVHEDITELTVGYLSETAVGIHAPKSVAFSASNERNGSYHLLGELETTPEDTTVAATYAKTLKTETSSGRYILVTITPAGYTDKNDTASIAPWTFIDEISIHSEKTSEGDTSDTSDPSDTSDTSNENSEENNPTTEDETDKTPQTGDDSLSIFAFVLLALASIAMMIALFTTKRNEDF